MACVNDGAESEDVVFSCGNERDRSGGGRDRRGERRGRACAAQTSERPWVFALLIAPSAVIGIWPGAGRALSYPDAAAGCREWSAIGAVISLLMLPQTLYFLWSPITDFLMRRRTWLMVGATCAGLLIGRRFIEELVGPGRDGGDVPRRVLRAAGGVELRRDDGGDAVRSGRRRVASSYYQGSRWRLAGWPCLGCRSW